ncbi:LOW QUALITY PROTEIN: hypothetical protein HID58_049373 [Brassica napus]|uniref:Uncharacterized protein n=1 Tax=Brassica napus TaxID=3708 RepID=A0ABQ8B4V4_BRANA|nr:LOW QUALITY PROTEIN: hypothetical protein HID58_049373 [Brassica napus]
MELIMYGYMGTNVIHVENIRFNGPKSPQYNIQKPKKTGQNTTKFWTQGPTTKTLRDKQGSAAARTNAAAPTSPSLRNTIGASIDCSRSHPSPFITTTERKASREPSPLTMVELRSSSDEISTNSNQTKSAKQGTPSPPGSRPTTAELTKPPPLGDRNRRRRSWRSLRLPETKPNSRTMSFTAPSSTRPRLYARDRSAMGGLSSGKTEERGNESEAKINSFNGGLRGSGDGTHAHVPAGHRIRPGQQFFPLFGRIIKRRENFIRKEN